jgi:hypothetical protein
LTIRLFGGYTAALPSRLRFSDSAVGPVEVNAMRTLSEVARWEGFILLGGLFGIIFWKLLTGGISLDRLLEGDIGGPNNAPDCGRGTYVSAGRAQSLAITAFAALYYLLQVWQNPREFPHLPAILIDALMGSQAIYLAGKAQAMLGPRLRSFLQRRMP